MRCGNTMRRGVPNCTQACRIVFLVASTIGAGALSLTVMAADREVRPVQTGIHSRDLRCATVSDARGRSICQRLQREMEWTWTGHAIISPGWRVTFRSVVRTYCGEDVGSKDITSLEVLRQTSKDWRAESGADFLIRLVRAMDGSAHEDVNSIFNTGNPSFILKGGCPVK